MASAGSVRLRDGLRFHDGESVLARDCVASINRWMRRDSCGRTLALRLDALEAPDDRTVVFRLKKQFPQLPFVLGKLSPNLMAVMPARLAATDANQPLTELVGSGPFRFVADEFSANSFATLARFQAYLPRNERPNGASGGRVARIDRVEWRVIPEPATQANALLTGEVDWINPTLDMIPLLRRATPASSSKTWTTSGSSHGSVRTMPPAQLLTSASAERSWLLSMVGRSSWRRSAMNPAW